MNPQTPRKLHPPLTASRLLRHVLLASALAGAVGAAQAGDPPVSVTVGGVISPGVYGRVEIGTTPPPPVLYPQPVVITQPVRPVAVQPVYMYVPPGHARHWGKHCARYNACGVPVYFVDERRVFVAQVPPGAGPGAGPGHEHGHRHGHGHGHGHGHDRDRD